MKFVKPTWLSIPRASVNDIPSIDIFSEGPDPEDDQFQRDSFKTTACPPKNKL